MKIIKTDLKIIFEFPNELNRYNPYAEGASEEGKLGTYPFFTGLIIRHNKNGNDWDEIGFANTIDMSYADKSDQVGEIIVAWLGEEEDFIKKCKELGISYQILEVE